MVPSYPHQNSIFQNPDGENQRMTTARPGFSFQPPCCLGAVV